MTSNYKQDSRNAGNLQQKSCTYCKISGHLWKDCRKLKADNERKRRFGSNQGYKSNINYHGKQEYRTNQGYKQNQYSPTQNQKPYTPPPTRIPQQQSPRQPFVYRNNNNQTQSNNNHRAMYIETGSHEARVHSGAFVAYCSDMHGTKYSWIVDSGASSHMSPHRELFTTYVKFEEPEPITIGDGTKLEALGEGNIPFLTDDFEGTFTKVLWVPGLKANLFSVGKAMDLNCSVAFDHQSANVYLYRDKKVVLSGTKQPDSNYFIIEMEPSLKQYDEEHAFVGASYSDWHKRLAHCSIDTVKALAKSDAVKGMKIWSDPKHECEACVMGKFCRAHHPERKKIRADKNSAILHMDTVGPIKKMSLGGARYFVLATEEYSGYLYFSTFESKDLIPDGVKQIITRAELDSGRSVKSIISDNGTEYKNYNLSSWLEQKGIIHDFSVYYTPEQNGRAERSNRTVLNGIRTLLYDSGLDESLWGEALNTVVYTVNRIPSRRNPDKTRYELFRDEKPDISNLRIFGQNVIYKQENKEGKLAQRGQKGVFVGYTERFNTYRIYVSEPVPHVIETCDIKFLTDASHPKILEPKLLELVTYKCKINTNQGTRNNIREEVDTQPVSPASHYSTAESDSELSTEVDENEIREIMTRIRATRTSNTLKSKSESC